MNRLGFLLALAFGSVSALDNGLALTPPMGEFACCAEVLDLHWDRLAFLELLPRRC